MTMERPHIGLADVLDLLAPWLDQWGRSGLQATCTALREAGMRSKVVNDTIAARVDSDEQRQSFLLWLGPRAHAVRHLSYRKSHMKYAGGRG